jgi:hypothetical protein
MACCRANFTHESFNSKNGLFTRIYFDLIATFVSHVSMKLSSLCGRHFSTDREPLPYKNYLNVLFVSLL